MVVLHFSLMFLAHEEVSSHVRLGKASKISKTDDLYLNSSRCGCYKISNSLINVEPLKSQGEVI